MRTGADDFVGEERDEAEFRHLLSIYGEPSDPPLPPNLVTRIARHIPHTSPTTLLRQRQIRLVLRWGATLALLALLAYGGWALTGGAPGATTVGSGAQGLGRAILSIRLALKPALAVFTAAALPLLLLGCASALGVSLLIWRGAQPQHDLRARA